MSVRIGQINVPKSGKGFHLKLDEGVTITVETAEGITTLTKENGIFLNDPAGGIDFLVQRGDITAEEAATKKAKIPDFVKYNVVA